MQDKEFRRHKRHGKIRKKLSGTLERPRLCVHRSIKNIYVQVIDDSVAKTLASLSTLDKKFSTVKPASGKVSAAAKLGELFAGQLKEKGIVRVAFDRGGYRYHGRVKALADSLRQAGIEL